MTKGFTEKNVPSQKGKTFLVTGANTGLGFHTTRVLSQQGARVLMGCRSQDKAQGAIKKLRANNPNADLEFLHIDLGDLASVKRAAEIVQKEERLDALINNAGIMIPPFQKTKDGFESQFGVNHLGTFALTTHLLEKLNQTENARVVNVSSTVHKVAKIDWDNLNAQKGYKAFKQYALSKLCNLMHIYALHRRFDAASVGTLALAAHPGGSDTDLFQNFGAVTKALTPLSKPFLNSAAQGAWPSLMAATSPQVQGGDYFGPRGLFEVKGPARKVKSTAMARDEVLQERLWTVSCELTGLTPRL